MWKEHESLTTSQLFCEHFKYFVSGSWHTSPSGPWPAVTVCIKARSKVSKERKVFCICILVGIHSKVSRSWKGANGCRFGVWR